MGLVAHCGSYSGYPLAVENYWLSLFIANPPSHPHSHHALPDPPPTLLRPSRRGCRPRAHRLPAGEAKGTHHFCNSHQLWSYAPSVVSGFIRSIAVTPREQESVTGAQGS